MGHKENGNSIFRYVYADTQKELIAKLHQSIQAYQGVELTEQSKMTLDEWLDKWLDERMVGTARSHTLTGYRRDLNNHVKPYLGQKQLTRITPTDLKNLYALLLECGKVTDHLESDSGLSPVTAQCIEQA